MKDDIIRELVIQTLFKPRFILSNERSKNNSDKNNGQVLKQTANLWFVKNIIPIMFVCCDDRVYV